MATLSLLGLLLLLLLLWKVIARVKKEKKRKCRQSGERIRNERPRLSRISNSSSERENRPEKSSACDVDRIARRCPFIKQMNSARFVLVQQRYQEDEWRHVYFLVVRPSWLEQWFLLIVRVQYNCVDDVP